MKDWRTWAILILLAVIFFFTWKSCKEKKETVIVPDTKGTVDSLLIVKRADSLKLVWQRDSIQMEREMTEEEKNILTKQMLTDEGKIRYLNKVINALRKDSGQTIFELSCDSLSDVALRLVNANDSLRSVQAQLDELMRYEIAIRDTAIEDLDRGQSAALDAALKSAAAFDAYRKENRPRGVLSIGVSGQWSPQQFGAGPSLIYTDKRGRSYQAIYFITNGRPSYQGGIAYPIRFK